MLSTDMLTKDHKARLYSLDPGRSISALKNDEDIQALPDMTEIATRLDQEDIQWMVGETPGYHFKFLRVPSKPYIVYAWGNLNLLDRDILGIVGPRKTSNYALQIMQDLFAEMGDYDLVTISGGAPGIDTACHDLSMKAHIPTIVVLGGGLAYYKTSSKRAYLERVVAAGGLVLSEFRLKQSPTGYTFPQRNRVIAGLSDVLFVPAAGQKSGSLITVDFARRIHTNIYTVPASIYESTSAGSNAYLAAGYMQAVVDLQEMLRNHFGEVDTREPSNTPTLSLTPEQKKLYERLHAQGGIHTISDLAAACEMSSAQVLSLVTILEMQGMLFEEQPGGYKAT